MKKITNAIFLSVLGAAVVTGCKNDDKKMENEEPRGINLAYMDTTASTKADFFGYVNGKWIDANKIPGDQTSRGSFNEILKKKDSSLIAI